MKLSTVEKMISSDEYEFARPFLKSVAEYMRKHETCTKKQGTALRNIRRAAREYKAKGNRGDGFGLEVMEMGWGGFGEPSLYGQDD